MNRLLLLVLLTALLSLDAWPQQRTTVGGTVVSGVTGQALAGVSVSGGGQTVVTNDDGYFLLKSDTPMSSIVVSHVGYRSVKVEGERLKVDVRTPSYQGMFKVVAEGVTFDGTPVFGETGFEVR